MKKSNYCKCGLLIVALSFMFFSGCATTSTTTATVTNPNAGTLVINRAANMGTGLFLNVSVDGKRVGVLGLGQSYSGSLSPGPHVVSVILEPNSMNLTPTKKRITAQKGQTYAYTAMWDGNILTLE